MRAEVETNGLTHHPDKSHVGDYQLRGNGSSLKVIGLKKVNVWCARKV
jgi:hypothetical protein